MVYMGFNRLATVNTVVGKDVYKRQMLMDIVLIIVLFLHLKKQDLKIQTLQYYHMNFYIIYTQETVSYTHLDVYKRQP